MNQFVVAARAQMLLDDPQKHATLHRRWDGNRSAPYGGFYVNENIQLELYEHVPGGSKVHLGQRFDAWYHALSLPTAQRDRRLSREERLLSEAGNFTSGRRTSVSEDARNPSLRRLSLEQRQSAHDHQSNRTQDRSSPASVAGAAHAVLGNRLLGTQEAARQRADEESQQREAEAAADEAAQHLLEIRARIPTNITIRETLKPWTNFSQATQGRLEARALGIFLPDSCISSQGSKELRAPLMSARGCILLLYSNRCRISALNLGTSMKIGVGDLRSTSGKKIAFH